jgi:hypothetical protein
MINFNGVTYTDIELLEAAMTEAGIPEIQKIFIRNDFNGVINEAAINTVPVSVTNNQLRLAMIDFAYDRNMPQIHPNAIISILKSMPASKAVDSAIQSFEYSNEMIRENPLISQMLPALGLTSELADELFILAATKVL